MSRDAGIVSTTGTGCGAELPAGTWAMAAVDGWSDSTPPGGTAPLAFELMMRIKQALDPNQLMNPGKLF